MLYPLVIAFTILYYVRPHEWIPGVGALKPVALTLAAGIFGLLLKGLPFNLKQMFKTPHDWFMAAFLLYVIYYAPSSEFAFDDLKNRIVLYLIVVHGLTSLREITSFCWWWCGLIAFVAVFAYASQFGFDPTGAQRVTQMMDGRLSLGTSIFNNPNALGHTVIPVIPMIYQLAFWRRPFFIKEIGLLMIAIPTHALVLTESKGAYLSGGLAIFLSFLFGRPLWVKVLIIFLALQFGGSILYKMPRMNVLRSAEMKQKDEGIYGRWLAFVWGLRQFDEKKHGVGYNKFFEHMNRDNSVEFGKAAHCSYVEAGAELGKQGLFLWLAVLFCCLRTLVMANCRTVEEERIRRLLFAVVIAYMASSWFTNITYRATFFLQAGVCAAFHRVLRERDERELAAPGDSLAIEEDPADALVETPMRSDVPAMIADLRTNPRDASSAVSPASPGNESASPSIVGVPPASSGNESVSAYGDGNDAAAETATLLSSGARDVDPLQVEIAGKPFRKWLRQRWRRIGILDFVGAYILMRVIHKIWAWVVFNM